MNDSAHGDRLPKKESAMEEGRIIGTHGSQSPLVEIVHNGMTRMYLRVTGFDHILVQVLCHIGILQ